MGQNEWVYSVCVSAAEKRRGGHSSSSSASHKKPIRQYEPFSAIEPRTNPCQTLNQSWADSARSHCSTCSLCSVFPRSFLTFHANVGAYAKHLKPLIFLGSKLSHVIALSSRCRRHRLPVITYVPIKLPAPQQEPLGRIRPAGSCLPLGLCLWACGDEGWTTSSIIQYDPVWYNMIQYDLVAQW